jgi:hypothetical protein
MAMKYNGKSREIHEIYLQKLILVQFLEASLWTVVHLLVRNKNTLSFPGKIETKIQSESEFEIRCIDRKSYLRRSSLPLLPVLPFVMPNPFSSLFLVGVLDTDRLLPFKVLPDISASFGSIFWA